MKEKVYIEFLGIFGNIKIVLIIVSNPVLQVAWEEEVDTVWRTTEAGMEEEDKEVTQVFF